jgi:hypothetical protein
MVTEPTPLTLLRSWWAQVPPEMAPDFGLFAGLVLRPHIIPDDGWRDSPDDGLGEALAVEPKKPSETAGRALAFITAIDFTFLGRSTQAEWDLVGDRNLMMADHMESVRERSDLPRKLRETVERFPFRSAMWIREYGRWAALREGPLSIRAVREWLLSQPVRI